MEDFCKKLHTESELQGIAEYEAAKEFQKLIQASDVAEPFEDAVGGAFDHFEVLGENELNPGKLVGLWPRSKPAWSWQVDVGIVVVIHAPFSSCDEEIGVLYQPVLLDKRVMPVGVESVKLLAHQARFVLNWAKVALIKVRNVENALVVIDYHPSAAQICYGRIKILIAFEVSRVCVVKAELINVGLA